MSKKPSDDVRFRLALRRRTEAFLQARAAIQTMRRFLDDAERGVARAEEDGDPALKAITEVYHAMAWGAANTQSDLAAALREDKASNDYLLELAMEGKK